MLVGMILYRFKTRHKSPSTSINEKKSLLSNLADTTSRTENKVVMKNVEL